MARPIEWRRPRILVRMVLVAILVVAAGLLGIFLVPGLATKLVDLAAPWRHGYRVERPMITMRDGARLAAVVALPVSGNPPFATVYTQTPYGAPWLPDGSNPYQYFTSRGYAFVAQHVRGRYQSEGTFTVTRDIANDSSDTLGWIVGQTWSNGRVGTIGCSYLGETQIALATTRHPAHRAMIPQGAGGAMGSALGSFGYFGVFEGGVMNLASAFGWFSGDGDKFNKIPRPARIAPTVAIKQLPLSEGFSAAKEDKTDFDDFLTHPIGDPWWDEMGYISDASKFDTPALHVNGWFDQTIAATFQLADLMRTTATSPAGKTQKVIVGPGTHCQDGQHLTQVGDLPIEHADLDYARAYDAWFGHWLRGEPLASMPNYQFFVFGKNAWMTSDMWPPPGADKIVYYFGDGGALAQQPQPETGVDAYRYDPLDPVPTLGGSFCCTGDPQLRGGSVDQRELADRQDVLVYTSTVLSVPLLHAGSATVELFVSSSAPDTDFTAKLIDLWPDGRAFNVRDGVVRARYRNDMRKPELMTPGEVYEMRITLPPIAYEFEPGHRIQLRISSSNFPRLERNLNTGGSNYNERDPVVAINRIHRGAETPSSLTLVVIPGVTRQNPHGIE